MLSLTVKVFRFNAKSDFLPYYKKYEISVKEEDTLLDILNGIKKQDREFNFSNNQFVGIRVNSFAASLNVCIRTIIRFLKTDTIILEPLSEFYAVNDLEVDTNMFLKQLDRFGTFINDDDREQYKEFVSYYFTSPAIEFEREYFGDSFMLFAAFLIKKYPQKKEDILRLCADENYGIWLYVSVKNTILLYSKAVNIENSIFELKRQILQYVPDTNSITRREAKRIENLSF
jgi:succinate dehydrogenase/fumarate reductase-like Fe-S protein